MTRIGDAFNRGQVESPDQNLSRFGAAHPEPAWSIGLKPDHPAVVNSRTLFPSTVVAPRASPRLLVSGHNNPKLGKVCRKAPRARWPIFQLSLEERATCPTSCGLWLTCYGNAMHMARRHDAFAPGFLEVLEGEIIAKAARYPDGFLVRLHTLGDFFSVAYVRFWERMLRQHPALAVFGYTARDPASEIGAALLALSPQWERFSIRWSRPLPGPGHAIVVDSPSPDPAVIMCPAQTEATMACATCGVCWSPAARGRTIGFLRHGMKRPPGPGHGRAANRGESVAEKFVRGAARAAATRARPAPPLASPAERLAAVPEALRAEIAARYGVKF